MDHFRSQAKAKAVTWEEYRRGGGGPSPERGPGPIERAIKNWALKLIDQEKQSCDSGQPLSPKEWLEAKARKGDLTMLFNRIKYDASLSGTLTAAQTILHYQFGLPRPSLT